MPESLATARIASTLPDAVWERIERHSPRLLMLDFDGTLAPFEVDRMAVRVPLATAEALERISRRAVDRVAIITGRPIREVRGLLGDLRIHMAGEHGWEERTPQGVAWSHELSFLSRMLLRVARLVAGPLGCHDLIEAKRAAVVIHTRGLTSAARLRQAAHCAGLWRHLAIAGLRLDPLDGGYELRDLHRGKHTVVRNLLRRGPPNALAVFVGDETSDEDAFAVLRPLGITIRVGTDERRTAAEWRLESPAEVSDFLQRWAALPEHGR